MARLLPTVGRESGRASPYLALREGVHACATCRLLAAEEIAEPIGMKIQCSRSAHDAVPRLLTVCDHRVWSPTISTLTDPSL